MLTVSACAKAPPKTAVVPAGPNAHPNGSPKRITSSAPAAWTVCSTRIVPYQSLRAIPSAANPATMGAIRAAGLIALRQRELGMVDEGYIAVARELTSSTPNLPAWIAGTLDVVDVLPPSIGGATRTATSDLDLDRSRALRLNREAWRETLRDLAPANEFGAYVWLSFACANEAREVPVDSIFAPTARSPTCR